MADDLFEKDGDPRVAADMLRAARRMSLAGSDPPVLALQGAEVPMEQGWPRNRGASDPVQKVGAIPLFLCDAERGARGIYVRQLARRLREHRPVVVLNQSDDGAREEVEVVAARYVAEVLSTGASPLFICGYCSGGLLAWHLVHLLRARGIEIAGFLLVETPSFNGGRGMRALASTLERMGALLPGRAREFVRDEAMRGFWAIKRVGMRGFTAALAKRLRWRRRRHDGSDRSRRHARDEALALNDYRRIARFVPPRLDVPVTCILAEDGMRFEADPARWQRWTSEVRVVRVPGTHATVVGKHRAELAAALEAEMAAAQSRARRSTSEVRPLPYRESGSMTTRLNAGLFASRSNQR